MFRPEKILYYLSIAEQVALRSPRLDKQYGAVIVKNDSIIATGYNGACEADKNKLDCVGVHAEQNAITKAGTLAKGGDLYLSCKTSISEMVFPCYMCWRLILNAHISRLIIPFINGAHYADIKRDRPDVSIRWNDINEHWCVGYIEDVAEI